MIGLLRSVRLLAPVVAASLVAGCGVGGEGAGEGDAKGLTMTVWTSDETQLRTLHRLADEFSKEHEGVRVRIQSIPQSEYTAKLSVRLAGGDAPDVGWLGANDAVGMAASGQLLDLTSSLKKDSGFRFGDYVPSSFTNWRHHDRLYGVPFSTSPFFTIYNKTMFADAGLPDPGKLAAEGRWTWSDLAKTAHRLQPELPKGSYAFQSNEGGMYGPLVWTTLDPLLRANGSAVYDPATRKCSLDSDKAAKAVKLYHKMAFSDGTAVPPGMQADFYAGRSAVTITQLSRLSQLDGAKFKWGVTQLPAGPGNQQHVTGQAGLVAFKKGKKPELAKDLVKFFNTPKATRKLAEFFPPARKSVLGDADRIYADSKLPPDAVRDVLVPGITKGKPFPYPVEWPQVRKTAESGFDRLWTKNADVSGVLHSMCGQLDPLLRRDH